MEEERPGHDDEVTRLQALLAGCTHTTRARLQATFAQLLGLSDDDEGPSDSPASASCSQAIHHAPRTLDVLGLEAGDAGGLTPASLQLLEQTMSEHSCFVVTSVGEAAVRGLFQVLGARNSDGKGWCVAMAPDEEELRCNASRTPADGGAATVTLLLLESHAARRLGSRSDSSMQAPTTNLHNLLEAPLLRDLTTRSTSVTVFCRSHDRLLPLLAAVAAVGRRLRTSVGGNALVVLPQAKWRYAAGGGAGPQSGSGPGSGSEAGSGSESESDSEIGSGSGPGSGVEPGSGSGSKSGARPENATVWFTVARCEPDRPDRLVASHYNLDYCPRTCKDGLVARQRPAKQG